jgi:Skp family chaperone for outer membrane proteins
VTKSRVFAAVAATVLAAGLFVCEARSQGNVGQPMMASAAAPAAGPMTAGPVALLDVSRIFKEHARFNGMMEEMKAYVQQVETWVKTQRDELRVQAEQMKDLQPGSQQYKDTEVALAKRQSDVQIEMQRQRKELMQREAKIYFNVYNEVQQEVEAVAAARGFVIVLRFNGDQVDVEQPDDVLRDINKSVIWFNRGVDITDEVLARIKSRSQQPANTATGSTENRQGIPLQPTRR